ncbi:hypothetical protein [Natronoglycomyces albus]|uniref:Zinc transporter permease n=1 Tax=Natronoglycomyces albus TaxID=2811108 RepID=A0A895XIY2_9ACTN|nr:hypothetical protein [Natronoglycomyces albus]QSB05751.1 hypothetical protein JQS30_02135 [Natronoglycomyces albus]
MDNEHVRAEHTVSEHEHGENCGHEKIVHNDHVDYLHGDHQHHLHGDHYDEHAHLADATSR